MLAFEEELCIPLNLHFETKLVQFALNILYNLSLEHLALFKDFFHCHSGNNNTSFALNNALDDFY